MRSSRKEGFSQGEIDLLFSALVLPKFTYGLSVYGNVDSGLTVIQNFLDRCFERKYTSKRMDIRELLEKTDKQLFKVFQWIPIARHYSEHYSEEERNKVST